MNPSHAGPETTEDDGLQKVDITAVLVESWGGWGGRKRDESEVGKGL